MSAGLAEILYLYALEMAFSAAMRARTPGALCTLARDGARFERIGQLTAGASKTRSAEA
jgi:hypothetical protein